MGKENIDQPASWRDHLKFDRDGKPFLLMAGAALFLECAPRTLSNHLYEETGPKAQKVNGKLRFYLDDLKIYDQGKRALAHSTNWHKLKKSA